MKTKSAFTIVELLVVIVVIGILATITIISYNGITTRAIASSLQSDLTNASKQLDLFQVEYNYYPSTIDCTIPDSSTNKCVKTSPSNLFTYSPGLGTSPRTYTLTATHNTTVTNYTITPNSPPIATAPLNPVADWLAMPRGDHYGNFYNLVSKQYATVIRSTPKTIYDPITNMVYDVPPNNIGIRPRSDGKTGYEAEIEESRANLLKNSKLTDNNGDSFPDFWPTSIYAGMIYSIEQDGNDNRMHVSFDNNNTNWVYEQIVMDSPVIGDLYTYSAEMETKNISPGTYISIEVVCVGGSTPYFSQSSPSGGTSAKKRYSFTFTVPSGTTQIRARFRRVSGNSITGDAWWSRPQFEKGNFSTSYIRTIDSNIVTRDADMITAPTGGLNYNQGTFIGVASKSTVSGVLIGLPGTTSNVNRVQLTDNGPSSQSALWFFGADGNIIAPIQPGSLSGYNVLGGSWDNGSAKAYVNGVGGTLLATDSMNGIYGTMYLGSYGTLYHHNTPIQRLITYSSALSDSSMLNIYNAVKNGP